MLTNAFNNIKMQKALPLPHPPPPPRSLRSLGLGRFAPSQVIFTAPLKLNPGYATVCYTEDRRGILYAPIKGIKGKCQGTSLEKRVHSLTHANIVEKA